MIEPNVVGTATVSACDQGTEVIVAVVTLHVGEPVDLRITLCQSPFQVVAFLDDQRIVDQASIQNVVQVTLPPLPPGVHGLSWACMPLDNTWKVLSEVSIGSVVRFRQRKSNQSNIPLAHTFLLLQVI